MGIYEDEGQSNDSVPKRSEPKNRGENDGDSDDSHGDNQRQRKNKKAKGRKKYCFCRSSRSDQFMIMCDGCQEWFHGTCVRISEKQAKQINEYYCMLCRSSMQNDGKNTDQPTNSTDLSFPFGKARDEEEYSPEEFEDDEDDDEFLLDQDKKGHKRKNRKTLPKVKPKKSNEKAQKRGRKKGQGNKTKENKGRSRKKNVTNKKSHDKHNRFRTHSEDSLEESKSISPKQCYGPGCIYSSRKGSKYCSDECGMNMANKRIMEILPQRIVEWQRVPCAADELSIKQMDEIKKEMIKCNNEIIDIERKKLELEELISRGKSCMPYTEEESAAILENEEDYAVSCVTCSQETSIKTALKHMERCFNKIESQTSFGSHYKTRNEKGLLCEVYSSSSKTYCKRLRILCPEHTKEPKVADDEVCGCPLASKDSPFKDSVDTFCRLLKKKCNIHCGWEKVRQAILDAEMVSQFFKMDELFERQNKVRQAMSNRRGLVPLLLHRTQVENESNSDPEVLPAAGPDPVPSASIAD